MIPDFSRTKKASGKHRKLLEILSKAGSIIVTCHTNADPDAFGSVLALTSIIKRTLKHRRVGHAFPEATNETVERIAKSLGIKKQAETPFSETKSTTVILVDTNSLDQTGNLRQRILDKMSDLIVIDHHAPERSTQSSFAMIDESATSACEVILTLARDLNVSLASRERLLLLCGIIAETKQFALATRSTFLNISQLLGGGVTVERCLEIMRGEPDRSVRVAHLKAAARMRLDSVGGWILASSHVNAHEASSAESLLALGADVAAIVGQHGDKVRVSLRASRLFGEASGIHLGKDVAMPLGQSLGGKGGGHARAAGVSGSGTATEALQTCLQRIKQVISQGR